MLSPHRTLDIFHTRFFPSGFITVPLRIHYFYCSLPHPAIVKCRSGPSFSWPHRTPQYISIRVASLLHTQCKELTLATTVSNATRIKSSPGSPRPRPYSFSFSLFPIRALRPTLPTAPRICPYILCTSFNENHTHACFAKAVDILGPFQSIHLIDWPTKQRITSSDDLRG